MPSHASTEAGVSKIKVGLPFERKKNHRCIPTPMQGAQLISRLPGSASSWATAASLKHDMSRRKAKGRKGNLLPFFLSKGSKFKTNTRMFVSTQRVIREAPVAPERHTWGKPTVCWDRDWTESGAGGTAPESELPGP